MRRLTATACAALSAASIITLTGCHSGKPHAATSALATSTAVKADRQQAAQIAKKCLPASETAQIKYARILVASKTGKYAQQGEQERQQLGQCAGIPPRDDDAPLSWSPTRTAHDRRDLWLTLPVTRRSLNAGRSLTTWPGSSRCGCRISFSGSSRN